MLHKNEIGFPSLFPPLISPVALTLTYIIKDTLTVAITSLIVKKAIFNS